jgi:hypothetical protein
MTKAKTFVKTIHNHLSLEKIQHWHGYANISTATGIYVHFTDKHNGRLSDKITGLVQVPNLRVPKKFVRKMLEFPKSASGE